MGDIMRWYVIGLLSVALVILLASFASAAQASAKGQWNYMESDVPALNPQFASIGVGTNGYIWVAYMGGSGEKYINVTWYDGNNWHNDNLYHGGFTMVGGADGAWPLAMCMNDSTPNVFYYTYDQSTAGGALNHSYYLNGAWHTETIWKGSLLSDTGKPANAISAKIANGKFYVLFQVYTANATSTPTNLLYLVSGTTGNWSTPIKVVSGNSHHFYYGELAVSNSKVGILIYTEYMDSTSSSNMFYVEFREYDGSSFSPLENITFTTNSYMATITYDISGLPHIFMGNVSGSNTYIEELYKNESGVWKSDVVAQGANNPNGPLCAALAPSGKIVLAYNVDGQSGIQFSQYSGGSWNVEALNDPLSGNALHEAPSITFDANGDIYVAYVNYNAEKADNYYVVIATNKATVPEFSVPLFILIVAAVPIVLLRFKH